MTHNLLTFLVFIRHSTNTSHLTSA